MSDPHTRRIPLQSISGPDDTVTESLRLLFYLVEVERQAEIFNRSLSEAISEAFDGDPTDVWRHIQAAMFAAVIVNRLVLEEGSSPAWPGFPNKKEGRDAAKKAAKWRVAELRKLLSLPDDMESTLIYQVKSVRNSLEHVDERLDRAFSTANASSLSDWYITDGPFLTTPERTEEGELTAGLRGFDPESGLLLFDRDPLNLFLLDIDLIKLRHNAREAQTELLQEVHGRLRYGGGQLLTFRKPGQSTLIERWKTKRRSLESEMPPPAPLDGRVRLWVQFESQGASTTNPDET